jgi:proteasome lid subunit RPN8/RPN11
MSAPTESVFVTRDVIAALVEHARQDAPNECCGFLVGQSSRIVECVRVTNVAASSSRFLVDPREHIALNRRLRGSGREVIGVYHSHPRSAATPSATDIADSHYPEFVYVIVSLADPQHPDVRAFRIRDDMATVVALITEGSHAESAEGRGN